jgi:hypothetical protein
MSVSSLLGFLRCLEWQNANHEGTGVSDLRTYRMLISVRDPRILQDSTVWGRQVRPQPFSKLIPATAAAEPATKALLDELADHLPVPVRQADTRSRRRRLDRRLQLSLLRRVKGGGGNHLSAQRPSPPDLSGGSLPPNRQRYGRLALAPRLPGRLTRHAPATRPRASVRVPEASVRRTCALALP